MKIIVAGGRDFKDSVLMCDVLNDAIRGHTDIEIVSGLARGADMLGKTLAEASNVAVKEFPANWGDMTEPCVRKTNRYGDYNALAGHKRNHAMGDYADMLIAFWDGKSKGTNEMIQYMTKLDKPVIIIDY